MNDMTTGRHLTERQEAIVEALLQGKTIPEAGRVAGYAHSSGAYQAVSSNAVQNELRARRRKILRLEGAGEATRTMIELLGKDNPASVRFQAAKFILIQDGIAAEGEGLNDKPLGEMTEAELEGVVDRLKERAGRAAQPPIRQAAGSHRDADGTADGSADGVPPGPLETGRGRGTLEQES